MFGKKKTPILEIPPQSQDVQSVRDRIEARVQPQVAPQPAYQPVQQVQAMPETSTRFCIAERAMIEQPQMVTADSGQVISTGQFQMRETIRIISNLSFEEMIDIVSNTPSNSSIHIKIRDLMKKMIK
jgi:hypothetical protein